MPAKAPKPGHKPPAAGLISVLALLGALQAAAQQPPILKQVDDHYNHLSTLRARYLERYTGMGLDRSESGTLLLKKPGRMRWAYDTPPGKVFILDGKYAWFYTPGDPQVQRTPAKQLDDLRSPLRFLLGHTELAKELDHISVTPNAQGDLISGVPKGMETRVRQLSLQVTPTGTITEMRIEEADGAVTDFQFTEIQENAPTADQDFRFSPPPGVTIVTGAPPV